MPRTGAGDWCASDVEGEEDVEGLTWNWSEANEGDSRAMEEGGREGGREGGSRQRRERGEDEGEGGEKSKSDTPRQCPRMPIFKDNSSSSHTSKMYKRIDVSIFITDAYFNNCLDFHIGR